MNTLLKYFLLQGAAILLFMNTGIGQTKGHKYVFVKSATLVQDKNFYLLSLFDRLPGVNAIMEEDTVLRAVKAKRIADLSDAAANCKEDAACHINHFLWKEDEILAVGNSLMRLYHSTSLFKTLVKDHLRKCGYFKLYENLSDTELLVKAWKDAAAGMNRILYVYGTGVPPKYPAIDSASYDVKTLIYRENINIVTNVMNELSSRINSFYYPSLQFALSLLDINMRDEAARFEPLDSVNRKCIGGLGSIDWSRFEYTAILIPGAGPDIITANIDPWAKQRLEIAVDLYRKGAAPVFIVSGGFVKPFQPPFSEGMEMKKYLMMHFQIPEDKILLEPFARHTTTNIRNAVRVLFNAGMPMEKKVLVVSDPYQTRTMQSEKFKERCLNELGYLPFTMLKPKSKFATEIIPSVLSLQVSSMDPLDP
jgi:hypothetical protein